MSRPKKDGAYINYYIDRELAEQLREYADNKGQTITTALERILVNHFKNEDKKKENVSQKR